MNREINYQLINSQGITDSDVIFFFVCMGYFEYDDAGRFFTTSYLIQ